MTFKTFKFLALTCLMSAAVGTDQIWAKPSQPKQADSQEIKAFTAEGDAEKAKNRDKEALAPIKRPSRSRTRPRIPNNGPALPSTWPNP